jgi:hypothetical protein
VSLAQAGPEPKRSADLSPHRSGGITVWGTEAEWHLDRRVPPGSAGAFPQFSPNSPAGTPALPGLSKCHSTEVRAPFLGVTGGRS